MGKTTTRQNGDQDVDQMEFKLAELRRRLVYADKPRKVAELQRMIRSLEAALEVRTDRA